MSTGHHGSGLRSGRPRAHQAPIFQGQQDPQEAQRQQAWRDYYARNPQNSYYQVAENEEAQYCFSGDMEVQIQDGTVKPMRQLAVGDRVLVSDDDTLIYQPVVMWLHRMDDQWATFLQIETASGEMLELTGDHALYKTDCKSKDAILTYAKDVRVGMCLVVLNGKSEKVDGKVVSISQIRKQGIYAPLTGSDTIVVNRMIASCYANLLLPAVHQTFFGNIRALAEWVGSIGMANSIVSGETLPMGVGFMMAAMQDVLPTMSI